MKFGIREITNVMMKAKSAMRLGNKVYYKDEPVLYFDSLKTSSLEGAATTVYAQGGRGNSRLIAWEGEKTLTFNMEDALLSPESFAVLSGAGLIEKEKIKEKDTKIKTTSELPGVDQYQVYNEDIILKDNNNNEYYVIGEAIEYTVPGDTLLSSFMIEILNSDRDKLLNYLKEYNNMTPEYNEYLLDDTQWLEYTRLINSDVLSNNGFMIFLFDSNNNLITTIADDGYIIENNVKLPKDGKVIIKYGWQVSKTLERWNDYYSAWMVYEDEWPRIIPVISYEIDKSELITGYEHKIDKVEWKKHLTNSEILMYFDDASIDNNYAKLYLLDQNLDIPSYNYSIIDLESQDFHEILLRPWVEALAHSKDYSLYVSDVFAIENSYVSGDILYIPLNKNIFKLVSKDEIGSSFETIKNDINSDVAAKIKTFTVDYRCNIDSLGINNDINLNNSYIKSLKYFTKTQNLSDATIEEDATKQLILKVTLSNINNINFTGPAILDYYAPIYNKTVKQLSVSSDSFGGNFYLEADTLFRDISGADHAATFIIPNCKVQSNFTFTMASSGDPSTFSFVLDAFPGYTRFDPEKKVLACLQINEKGIYEDGLEDRESTPWAPGAENY